MWVLRFVSLFPWKLLSEKTYQKPDSGLSHTIEIYTPRPLFIFLNVRLKTKEQSQTKNLIFSAGAHRNPPSLVVQTLVPEALWSCWASSVTVVNNKTNHNLLRRPSCLNSLGLLGGRGMRKKGNKLLKLP